MDLVVDGMPWKRGRQGTRKSADLPADGPVGSLRRDALAVALEKKYKRPARSPWNTACDSGLGVSIRARTRSNTLPHCAHGVNLFCPRRRSHQAIAASSRSLAVCALSVGGHHSSLLSPPSHPLVPPRLLTSPRNHTLRPDFTRSASGGGGGPLRGAGGGGGTAGSMVVARASATPAAAPGHPDGAAGAGISAKAVRGLPPLTELAGAIGAARSTLCGEAAGEVETAPASVPAAVVGVAGVAAALAVERVLWAGEAEGATLVRLESTDEEGAAVVLEVGAAPLEDTAARAAAPDVAATDAAEIEEVALLRAGEGAVAFEDEAAAEDGAVEAEPLHGTVGGRAKAGEGEGERARLLLVISDERLSFPPQPSPCSVLSPLTHCS